MILPREWMSISAEFLYFNFNYWCQISDSPWKRLVGQKMKLQKIETKTKFSKACQVFCTTSQAPARKVLHWHTSLLLVEIITIRVFELTVNEYIKHIFSIVLSKQCYIGSPLILTGRFLNKSVWDRLDKRLISLCSLPGRPFYERSWSRDFKSWRVETYETTAVHSRYVKCLPINLTIR